MIFDLFFVNTAYADVDTFIHNVNRVIINPLIYLLFALALVYFLYGMYEFISNPTVEERKVTGKQHMIWGIVGLTIMFSIWGILKIVLNTLEIDGIDPKNGTVELNDYNPSYPAIEN